MPRTLLAKITLIADVTVLLLLIAGADFAGAANRILDRTVFLVHVG